MWFTATQAKAHLLRPDLADDDPDLVQKMTAAEAAILGYINTTAHWRTITAAWIDPATVPYEVQAAALLKLAEMWRYRGDEADGEGTAIDDASDMSPAIVRLLRRWRDPVLV